MLTTVPIKFSSLHTAEDHVHIEENRTECAETSHQLLYKQYMTVSGIVSYSIII